jgi:hypothetical protein
MIAPDPSKPKKERAIAGHAAPSHDLPFRVELWDDGETKAERVVARAHSATLAQAVFNAACEQYPGRHLSLWRGRERLAERS